VSRYQLGDEICSIDLVGAKITIVEPDGTQRVEELVNAELARTRLRVLTNQRMRAGWKVVREAPAPAPPPPALVENARNPELEAALLADPELVPSWLVYGDWLQQQNDPRGTYIALRAAARAAPDDLIAADRVRKFGNQHAPYLHGGFGGVLGWGFLDAVRATHPSELDVFAAPSGRFITKLEIDHTPTRRLADIIAALGRHDPVTLRELSVIGEAMLATLEPVEAILARLHVLHLHCAVAPSCLEQLVRTPMPRLTRLGLRNRESGTRDALVALLRRADLPALTSLHLDEQTRAPHLYEALAASPLARQLQSLVLVSIEEDDLEALAGRLDAFPKLVELEFPIEGLDLPRSLLSELEARIDRVVGLRGRYTQIAE
jgi:uncharacterized protein (TIGR02996 family)